MRVGDLIWYNCAGSTQTGIVLGFTKNTWLDHERETVMMKIYWTGGTGPRPVMYDLEGRRLWDRETRKFDSFECYVSAKSRSGHSLFKIISRA